MNVITNFQKKHGLVADGIIGKNTLLKIKEVYRIPTLEATAHFMGNAHHESGGFKILEENLNYSADGLFKIFKKYFPTLEIAKQYARKPEAIANKVYGGRMGNVDEGDGWKFRGRGVMQTTGKTNYKLLGDFLDVDLVENPDLVKSDYALESAVFYFNSNGLWGKASKVDDDTIKKIRKAVNGGYNGLDDVANKVRYYYQLMNK